MQHRYHHRLRAPLSAQYSLPRTAVSRDRFHLPTVLAQNDPFLRRFYSIVTAILDDHPYPITPAEIEIRTREIQKEVRNLRLVPPQRIFLDRLMNETNISLVDLWQGSHVIVLDGGYLYNTWSRRPEVIPRTSSHYRNVPIQQYGINFIDHQLLFGKTALDGSTWFQMEAHGFEPNEIANNPDLFFRHGQDFLKYRLHRMNVGPFGFSPHTESQDPIVVQYQPSVTRRSRHLVKPPQRSQRRRRSIGLPQRVPGLNGYITR